MKPQIIRAQGMGHPETNRIVRWMEANGLRHYVPEDAEIHVHGNRFTVDTFDIARAPRARSIKTQTHGRTWWHWARGEELPRRSRTYRIRYDLKDIK